MNDISVLIIKASEKQASDLYIRENTYPYIRNKEGNVILLVHLGYLFIIYNLF